MRCVTRQTGAGWWVEFPDDPLALLLLESDGEKIQFAKDCGVDLDDDDLLLALDLGEIDECPDTYYLLAKIFKEEPYW